MHNIELVICVKVQLSDNMGYWWIVKKGETYKKETISNNQLHFMLKVCHNTYTKQLYKKYIKLGKKRS